MFYEQLKKACDLREVKLTPLLKEMKISTGNTGSWKKGGNPSVEVLDSLSSRLEVSTDYLLGRTDNPARQKTAPHVSTQQAVLIFAREKLGREPTMEDIAMIESAVDIAVQHIGKQRK